MHKPLLTAGTSFSTDLMVDYFHLDPAHTARKQELFLQLNDRAFQLWQASDEPRPGYFVFALTPSDEDALIPHNLLGEMDVQSVPGYTLHRWAFSTRSLATTLQKFLRELPETSSWVFHNSFERT